MKRDDKLELAELLGEEPPKPERPRYDKSAILKRLMKWVASGKTLLEFCEQDGTPTSTTLYKWIDEDPLVVADYRQALAHGYDQIAQECKAISDRGDESDVKHRKLQISTRLQLLARWDPKRYSERLTLADDPDNPRRVRSDIEIMTEVAELMATAKTRQMHALNGRKN